MKKLFVFLALLTAMSTLNAQIDTLFFEGFENGTIPTGWNNLDQDGDGEEWEIAGAGSSQFDIHTGNGAVVSYSYNNYETYYPSNWLVTPAITLTNGCALKFWRRTNGPSYSADHYGVYVSTTSPTDLSTFTLLYEETVTSANYLWEEKTLLLTGYANQTVYIAFRHFNCTDEWFVLLDDILVGQITSPYLSVSPSELSFCANVNGEAIGSASVTAFNLSTGVTATTSSPFAVSSDNVTFGNTAVLSSNGGSLYVRYTPTAVGEHTGVVALAGNGVSDTLTVTGQCVLAATLPFTCDFESDTLNQLWHFVNDTVNRWYIGTAASNGGSRGLYISNNSGTTYAYTETTPTVSWAYIDVDLGQYFEYKFSYDVKVGGDYADNTYLCIAQPVSVSPGSTDIPGNFGYIGPQMNFENWEHRTFSMSSSYNGIRRFYFLWHNDENAEGTNPPAAYDNFSIIGYSCEKPTNLVFNNITATSADCSFTPGNPDDQAWEYALTDGSQSPDNVPHVLINTPAFHLTGLTPSSYYEVFVRTLCDGGGYSAWSSSYYLNTPETCPTPFNLSFPSITGTTATVTWSPNYAATGNETYRVECIAGDGTTQTIITTSLECVITGLEPQTSYTVMVYMDCGEDDHSDTLWATLTTNCLSGGNMRIGQGTNSSSTLPFYYGYNNYSQQIYLASEMNGPHEIQSIAFEWFNLYGNTYAPYTRNLKIYLMHTDSTTNTHWLDATTATLVFSNDSTPLAQGWNTFTFNAPFQYDGVRNLAVIVVDYYDYSTPSYYSTWRCHTAPGLACYALAYDPLSISTIGSLEASPSDMRNDVIFGTPCDTTVACIAPLAQIDAVTGNSITVSWVPGYQETAWDVQYKVDGDSLWTTAATHVTTTSFTLDSLQIFTTYAVRVGSICDNAPVWCDPLYALTGSYTMPFQGSDTLATCDMLIYDNGGAYGDYSSYCNSILVLYPENDNTTVSLSGTCMTENGFDFLYIYDGVGVSEENLLYTFTGTQTIPTITSSTGPLTILFTSDQLVSDAGFELHVGCSSCLKPSNVQVSNIGPHSAVVSWTGDADNYEFWYANIQDTASTTLSVAGATSVTLSGLEADTWYGFWVRSDCGDSVYSLKYADSFLTLPEGSPEPCDPPTELHQVLDENGNPTSTVAWTYIAGASQWNVQYALENEDWTTVTVNTTSYEIPDMQSDVNYFVRVQAVCDNGVTSDWSYIMYMQIGLNSWLANRVTLYPNPAREYVDIRVDGDVNVTGMEVYDVYGKIVRDVETRCTTSLQTTRINVSGLANGMYFVRLVTEQGMVTKTFVKR